MPTVHARRLAAILACVVLSLGACAFGPQARSQPRGDRAVTITVRVIDEQDRPISGAFVTAGEEEQRTNADGITRLSIAGPVVVNVSTPNRLVEPVAIGPDDADGEVIVRLWDRVGVDGATRSSLHFGGDVMLGRRYLQQDLSTPFIDDAASARAVVRDLAPLSAAADFTVVNLETVVGDLPDEFALAAKRFLLQSTPLVTETLDEMGADLVTLGNNHAYDWSEEGIASTLNILDEAGIAHVGAGTSRANATRGTIVDLGEMQIGVVSSTTVNGSFVNDQLPAADALVPDDLPAAESWQYENRVFSYRSTDGRELIVSDERRIGEAWSIFESLEDGLREEEAGRLWAAIVVSYPELQDWVARRGHGGAAPYRRTEMEEEIIRLRNEGADFVVVQIHGGYQFAEVNSTTLERISHDAIDAGADAVVSHHPHVLQGVEWYAGKLIVYSLGNLLFDQGFLATFPGAILRLVTDGNEIIEARFLPVVLDRYRPVPVTGGAAQQIIGMIDARSALPAMSGRVNGLSIGSVLDAPDAVSAPPLVAFERNSGLISTSRSTTDVSLVAEAGVPQKVPTCALVRTDQLSDDVEVGVDLFGWGRFDDDTADGRSTSPLNWSSSSDADRWQFVTGASGDPFDDAFELSTDKNSTTSVQIGARIDVDAHRLFAVDGSPLDRSATYEVMLDARRSRGETPSLRLVSFKFDDSDPTVDPDTDRIHEVNVPISVPDDDAWHHLTVKLPQSLFEPGPGGQQANTATMLVDTPSALRGRLAIDNVRIVEWRARPDITVPFWARVDLLRSATGGIMNVTTSGCPAGVELAAP